MSRPETATWILAASLLLTYTAIAKDVPATEKKIADFEAD
jgi:hypothetical protein